MQMGTLLALPPSFDVAGLRTEPARILARALQDYGAHVVDNTGWNVLGIATEWGPDGRVTDQVAADFGVHFGGNRNDPKTPATADFNEDLDAIVAGLHDVDNNGPDSVGGGGTPRAPLAPPFAAQP
jgi:hypothetical protein